MNAERFRFFSSVFRESDLLIGVPHADFHLEMPALSMEEQTRLYKLLDSHSGYHPGFKRSLEPLKLPESLEPFEPLKSPESLEPPKPSGSFNLPGNGSKRSSENSGINKIGDGLPPEIEIMYRYGEESGTGPMSSVAGLFAGRVAKRLIEQYNPGEVVVENGGDLFIKNSSPLLSVIHAGSSLLSDKMGLVIPPGEWGVCTSSGTLGHSYSRGRADAVTVVCESAPLADAWATSLANLVKGPDDIEPVLERVADIPAIVACVVIVGDRMGIRGGFEIKPL